MRKENIFHLSQKVYWFYCCECAHHKKLVCREPTLPLMQISLRTTWYTAATMQWRGSWNTNTVRHALQFIPVKKNLTISKLIFINLKLGSHSTIMATVWSSRQILRILRDSSDSILKSKDFNGSFTCSQTAD